MIQDAPQPGPHGSRGQQLDALQAAREDLIAVADEVEPLLEALEDQPLDDLRPRLSDMMRRLLDGTRVVVESAQRLTGDVEEEVEDAQRTLSNRLLDFRRAIGSGSTDTIRQSLHIDLAASATNWNRLLDAVVDSIKSTGEDA